MASWSEIEAAVPELAAKVSARLDAHVHKTLATLRADGSPRISGTELGVRAGELVFGSMPGALKGRDLKRDPRLAVHSGSEDPPGWKGDAKVGGRAVHVTDPEEFRRLAPTAADAEPAEPAEPGSFDLFRIDVLEVVHVGLGEPADHLVIESWRPERGYERVERR